MDTDRPQHHQHLYIHLDEGTARFIERMLHHHLGDKLDQILSQLNHQEKHMATLTEQVQELKDAMGEVLGAIQAEKAEIAAGFDALNKKLEDAIANGGSLTPEQMADLKADITNLGAKVRDISEPEPAPAP